MSVWEHPIDLHLKTTTLQLWPKIVLKVAPLPGCPAWLLRLPVSRLTSKCCLLQVFHRSKNIQRDEFYGYSVISLPTMPGIHEFSSSVWRPNDFRSILSDDHDGESLSCRPEMHRLFDSKERKGAPVEESQRCCHHLPQKQMPQCLREVAACYSLIGRLHRARLRDFDSAAAAGYWTGLHPQCVDDAPEDLIGRPGWEQSSIVTSGMGKVHLRMFVVFRVRPSPALSTVVPRSTRGGH